MGTPPDRRGTPSLEPQARCGTREIASWYMPICRATPSLVNPSTCMRLSTISDASITPNSIVILNYTDAGSNGNAQALTAQGSGFFNTTGSPNRCFQYVVLNTAP